MPFASSKTLNLVDKDLNIVLIPWVIRQFNSQLTPIREIVYEGF